MDTEELDEELDYFRERIIQLVNGGTHSEQTKNSLLGVADKLETAQDGQVPGNVKAMVLSLSKLVLRAASLPEWTIDDSDSKLLGSILQSGTRVQ